MLNRACFALKNFFSSWPIVLVGLIFSGWALLYLPQHQVEQVQGEPLELAKLTDEYRRTIAQVLGGVWLLVGLYLGWRRVRAAEETQLTERFTQAIAQLGQEGNDKMAIRLGGIYALERIAKDSEKDHGPIMEVLTAYVREKAPRQEDLNPLALGAKKLPTDIQAILTVIGRRETTGKKRGNDRLNLSKTELGGAILPNANLTQIDLIQANLSWADLKGADMRGANLEGAILSEADLSEAKHLTADQVRSVYNWRNACLPDYLKDFLEPPA